MYSSALSICNIAAAAISHELAYVCWSKHIHDVCDLDFS